MLFFWNEYLCRHKPTKILPQDASWSTWLRRNQIYLLEYIRNGYASSNCSASEHIAMAFLAENVCLKCCRNVGGRSCPPGPAKGAYSAPRHPSCGTLLLRGKDRRGGAVRERRGRRMEEGKEGEGKGGSARSYYFIIRPLTLGVVFSTVIHKNWRKQ